MPPGLALCLRCNGRRHSIGGTQAFNAWTGLEHAPPSGDRTTNGPAIWCAEMIDHVSLRCRDFESSKQFYEKALKPLGYSINMTFPDAVGFGVGKRSDFWITPGEVGTPAHIAFACENRALVDAFYKAALEAGAKDNGAPGVRRDEHPHYYGAFVLDPSGHNIEAVCHTSAAPSPAKKAARPTGKNAPTKKKSAGR
jgi:catechol 2,3-dioxygenase-like lactoylglutathione lyase family enzyme